MVEAVTTTRDRLRLLPLLFTVLALPSGASAHRLDEYLQATLVAIEPGDVRLRINLTPGEDVAEQVLALIDRDRDGAVSTEEASAYAELFKRDLTVRLDGRDVELKLAASNLPQPAELRTGWGIVQMEFSTASLRLAPGVHTLRLENRHLPTLSAYLCNAGAPESDRVRINRQDRNENQSAGEIEFALDPPGNPSRAGRVVAGLAVLIVAVFAPAWRARSARGAQIRWRRGG